MSCHQCGSNNLLYYSEHFVRLSKTKQAFVHDYTCRDCHYDERYLTTLTDEQISLKRKSTEKC